MTAFPPPSFPMAPTPVGNGRRFGAFLLDGVLTVLTCGIGWLIWSVVLWQQSTSPAKKMLKMRVVDARTGAPATMNQMVMRELVSKLVLVVGLNYLGLSVGIDMAVGLGNLVTLASAVMVLATAPRRAVWDHIAGTVVTDAS